MSITKKTTLRFAIACLMMAALWLVGMSTPVHAATQRETFDGITYIVYDGADSAGVWDWEEEITSANIKDKVEIGGKTYNVTYIDEEAFDSCNSLKSVTIPSSITKIGFGAFGYCTSLTSVTIPSSITEIGEAAFANTGLKEIKIPSSVKLIEEHAFGYNYDEDKEDYVPVSGFIIYGATGSEAEKYAKKFNIKFVDRDAEAKKAAAQKAAAIKEAQSLKTKVKTKALKKHKATVSWKKVSKANGYEIYRANKKAGKYKKIKTVKNAKVVKLTDKKLKKGKRYFYKVRTYKVVDGKKVYGKWSNVAKIKAK